MRPQLCIHALHIKIAHPVFQLVYSHPFTSDSIEYKCIAGNADTKCVFQIFLHIRHIIHHRLPSMFPGNKVGNILNRARAIKRVHGDQIVKLIGFEFAEVFLHTCAFKLERTVGFAALVEFIRFAVVQRNIVDVDSDAMVLFDQFHGIPDDRQRFQAQKVHLNNARIFDHRSFKLRQQQVGIFHGGHRNNIREVVRRNNDTCGVNARSAHRTFEDQRLS